MTTTKFYACFPQQRKVGNAINVDVRRKNISASDSERCDKQISVRTGFAELSEHKFLHTTKLWFYLASIPISVFFCYTEGTWIDLPRNSWMSLAPNWKCMFMKVMQNPVRKFTTVPSLLFEESLEKPLRTEHHGRLKTHRSTLLNKGSEKVISQWTNRVTQISLTLHCQDPCPYFLNHEVVCYVKLEI